MACAPHSDLVTWVVLGMHKSGTTLVADLLHRSGIPMVEDPVAGGYDEGNTMERTATKALNRAMLGDLGAGSARLTRSVAPGAIPPAMRAAAVRLLRRTGPGGWGFKDPRTLLTFALWGEVLTAPRIVGVFRDPAAVLSHYRRQTGWRGRLREPGHLVQALEAWCVHNRALLEICRSRGDVILLDYARLMSGEAEMQRLAAFLGRPLVDCRRPELHRAQPRRTWGYLLARWRVRRRRGLDADRLHDELCGLRATMAMATA